MLFVPRKVAKALGSQKNAVASPSTITQSSVSHINAAVLEPHHAENLSTPWKGKGKDIAGTLSTLSNKDHVMLFRLALSEHSLWSDPELRRNLEHSSEGFIPLTYISGNTSYFCPQPSEATLAKALRTYGGDFFDVRLLLSSPSRAEWYGNDTSSTRPTGDYEIRMKDWQDALKRSRNWSRNEWEAQTIYVENIPAQYRSIAGIYRLVYGVLPPGSLIQSRIQSISLPKHHLDQVGDTPRCKGFALVTLLQSEDVNYLLQQWPWKRSPVTSVDSTDPYVHEASKHGLRMIQKARWDQLNSEYMQYHQRLLEEVAEHERLEQQSIPDVLPSRVSYGSTIRIEEQPSGESLTQPPSLDLSAPYPPGCLVHVRHIHPETNKTTLRKLFAKAAPEGEDGIDYVDFRKGMDTCYLRLATPNHTTQLANHFKATPTIQSKALDDTGSSGISGEEITIEIVEGTREELYWMKVPEKLRRQAVEKTVFSNQSYPMSSEQAQKRKNTDDVQAQGGRNPRRRRKR